MTGPTLFILLLVVGALLILGVLASRSSAAGPRPSPPQTCAHCGQPVVPGARFCGQCGQALPPTNVT